MVKRTYNLDNNEPDQQKKFNLPSEREHLFQVVEVYDHNENPFKDGLDPDTVVTKCEVVGGDEEGRTLLQRMTLDANAKGFFATRLFLKAIGEPHKGDIEIDSDHWNGRLFYSTVVHNGKYANLHEYNFEKRVEQNSHVVETNKVTDPEQIQWDG